MSVARGDGSSWKKGPWMSKHVNELMHGRMFNRRIILLADLRLHVPPAVFILRPRDAGPELVSSGLPAAGASAPRCV